ncbi:GNAT family N-acetyltransferase [Robiginitalea marina]|uniref:GNAT family N-acetyltransferase n=1 Tax=Robiginitalea marina TaxID=2954105 RepID=A0ABT1B2C8_9FLAO|nr:GNAT family N-acetyltransferase [Robiginitalea marina]MCO5725578.1 GNAT family N-acetyltransferase [Robiginitalea marina]
MSFLSALMDPMVELRQATHPEDAREIAGLASTIWREHYTPIIGKAQVEYMLERFQSAAAIADQIKGGMQYYLILSGGHAVGYLAFEKQGEGLFLSKIYLLNEFRGKGLGREAMEFISREARDRGCSTISLTVNKNNTRSIAAYEGMGFKKKEALVMDIGGGFVMDDYRMEKAL